MCALYKDWVCTAPAESAAKASLQLYSLHTPSLSKSKVPFKTARSIKLQFWKMDESELFANRSSRRRRTSELMHCAQNGHCTIHSGQEEWYWMLEPTCLVATPRYDPSPVSFHRPHPNARNYSLPKDLHTRMWQCSVAHSMSPSPMVES